MGSDRVAFADEMKSDRDAFMDEIKKILGAMQTGVHPMYSRIS